MAPTTTPRNPLEAAVKTIDTARLWAAVQDGLHHLADTYLDECQDENRPEDFYHAMLRQLELVRVLWMSKDRGRRAEVQRQITKMSPGELLASLRELTDTVTRDSAAASGLGWVIKMREAGKAEQVDALVNAILASSERNPGRGDAVDYVRACLRGPFHSVYYTFKVAIGDHSDPDDFIGPEEEFFQEKESAIGFFQGVLRAYNL